MADIEHRNPSPPTTQGGSHKRPCQFATIALGQCGQGNAPARCLPQPSGFLTSATQPLFAQMAGGKGGRGRTSTQPLPAPLESIILAAIVWDYTPLRDFQDASGNHEPAGYRGTYGVTRWADRRRLRQQNRGSALTESARVGANCQAMIETICGPQPTPPVSVS